MSRTSTIEVSEILDAPLLDEAGFRTLPAFPPPAPHDPELLPEYQAFLRLYPALLQTHYGKYVAIHGGTMVESSDTLLAAVSRSTARFGRVPIYVNLVTDKPQRVERIPTLSAKPRECLG